MAQSDWLAIDQDGGQIVRFSLRGFYEGNIFASIFKLLRGVLCDLVGKGTSIEFFNVQPEQNCDTSYTQCSPQHTLTRSPYYLLPQTECVMWQ